MRVINTLLFFAIFILGVSSLNQDSIREVQPAMFLPADTLVYIEQKNGAESLARFRNSRLGRILTSIDFSKVLLDAEADINDIERIERVLELTTKVQDDVVFKALLGKRLALALIGKREWSPNAEDISSYVQSHLLLISRPGGKVEDFERMLTEYIDGRTVSPVPYGRYTIKRIPITADQTIAATYVDGLILVAFEERVLRESLDLYDKNTTTLKNNPDFINISHEMAGANQLLYCSVEALQQAVTPLQKKLSDPFEIMVLHQILSIKGVDLFSYTGIRQKKILKNRVIIGFEPATMDKRIKEMIATAPSINDSLPYAARDVLLYYWSNSLELQLLWEMYSEKAGAESSEVLGLQRDIRELFGYEVNDLIEMIGSDVGVMVRENGDELFVPIPDLALFVKLDNTASAEDAIQQAVKNLDITLIKSQYNNIEYFSWGLDPKESLQPVYTIHRNYLILANTLNMLKTIIDTPINNTRLVGTKGFREIDPGFQTLNNSVCYVDQARLLRRLQEIVGWAGTMLAIQDRNAAEKSKILIDNLIDPLFWGMSMYEKTAIRTYVRDDQIYIESHTKTIN